MDRIINVWILQTEHGRYVYESMADVIAHIDGDMTGAERDEKRTYSIIPETMYRQDFLKLEEARQ